MHWKSSISYHSIRVYFVQCLRGRRRDNNIWASEQFSFRSYCMSSSSLNIIFDAGLAEDTGRGIQIIIRLLFVYGKCHAGVDHFLKYKYVQFISLYVYIIPRLLVKKKFFVISLFFYCKIFSELYVLFIFMWLQFTCCYSKFCHAWVWRERWEEKKVHEKRVFIQMERFK